MKDQAWTGGERGSRGVLLAAFMLGCGDATSAPAPTPAAAVPFGGADAGRAPTDECAEATKNVYVISEENTLYAFRPLALAFDRVGPVACATNGSVPTSMAVDRRGTAWVRHKDGTIWKLDTRSLACASTTFVAPDTTEPFFKFGMGFSSSAKGSSSEELFLGDNRGAGLARLDTARLRISLVGPWTGELVGKGAELTGTGDGKLYGLFTTSPMQIAEIDKRAGTILSTKALDGTFTGTGYAFSFYGGDFFVYTSEEGQTGGSDVTRYRTSDGSVAVVKSKVGFKIVGAGVSTCAPTEGPR